MKKLRKITLLVLCATSFILPFLSNATFTITQGDTTFGVDEGDTYLWTATGGLTEYIGYKYELTIEDIYNGSYMTINSYIIEATLRLYNNTEKIWLTFINNAFFLAANETLDFIAYNSFMDTSPLFFILPTPINLTMIGKYALTTGYYYNYTIDGNQMTLDGTLGFDFISTFNSDGFLTKFVMKFADLTIVIFILGSGGGEAVPYGYFFMIFTLIGVISLVYLEKRKTK